MRSEEEGLRIVFFGNSHSHFSTCFFQALIASPGELVGLVDTPAKKRGSTNPLSGSQDDIRQQAEQLRVPVFEPEQPNEQDFVETIRAIKPDLILAVGYTNILRAPILQVPRCLAANFHASLLPAYRGKHPVFWCLRNGERWSGLTVHVMDSGIDTGDILYQVKVRTHKKDSVSSLYDRIIERSLPLAARLVEEARRGVIRRRPQPQTGATYFSSFNEADFQIDWRLPAETLRRWISASPGECFTVTGEGRVYLLEAETVSLRARSPEGEIVEIGRKWGTIACRGGGLRVRRIHRGTGEAITFRQWCDQAGYHTGSSISVSRTEQY